MAALAALALAAALQGAAPPSGVGAPQSAAPSVSPADAAPKVARLAPAGAPRYPNGVPARVGELIDVRNIRSNKLVGLGLVTGLLGTGDASNFAKQQIANLASKLNLTVLPSDLNSANVAIVVLEAELRPFAQPGQVIDCFVSSYGDAKSLAGGRLLRAPLFGPDPDQAIAVASGPVILGGAFTASGQGASLQKNHTTAGVVPGGAQVEDHAARAAMMRPVTEGNALHLDLRRPEAVVASRIADAVNAAYPGLAFALSPGSVRVIVPPESGELSGEFPRFLGRLLDLTVQPFDRAVVLVDEKTSTVIVTGSPTLGPCLIARGNLTISIAESPLVSQPNPLSETGDTTVVPRTDITATEESRPLTLVQGAATLSELADVMNTLGATPRELIDILTKLRSAGALHAEIQAQ